MYAVFSSNLVKFTPDRNFLHGHRPWCPWQIWGMFTSLLQKFFFGFEVWCSDMFFGWAKLGFMNIRYLAIWIFGKVRRTWPSGVSLKRAQKMQLRQVDLRSVGHSNQKLSQKIDFREFHHVNPLEHFKLFATDRLWVYNAEIFFVASFDHRFSGSQDRAQLKKKVFSEHPNPYAFRG